MTHTDPIADMLSRINNARVIFDEEVEVPHSNMKEEIARILDDEGFIAGYTLTDNGSYKNIQVRMKYGPNREQVISGVKRVSKPGLRVYRGKEELPEVLGGLGIAILSTSRGVMTDKEARKEGIGGEVLCYVW